ncbi:MAG TPA: cytochrome b5 domain-containing protein [Chryseolinea sp.]|jgi:predicted heme/steroid binding protein|nr:cytochrome b5 domain-containing protein [Chryseolinea sp.]
MSTDALPTYSRTYLALRNGQDKPEIWVAYKGMIYDVSRSRLWRAGKHYEHWAGQDLTEELGDAPHNENVFDKFKIIGMLEPLTTI